MIQNAIRGGAAIASPIHPADFCNIIGGKADADGGPLHKFAAYSFSFARDGSTLD
jgi:hypothetical protein